jgi:subtilisin family serine protease
MRPARTVAAALGTSLALIFSSLAASATPTADASQQAPTRSASRAAAAAQGGSQEFVVAFQPDRQAEATAAISEAGGTVIDVTEGAGVALVSSTETAFLQNVRDAAAVTGATQNHSVGTSRPGMPHRFAAERPSAAERSAARAAGKKPGKGSKGVEPLADRQWDMATIGATPDGAWRKATGRGVTVGVIDTGVDASHPDLAKNFSSKLSRNFTMDIPSIDGPCEVPTCVDPANVDQGGHGTHVAGTIAAARNGIGIAGVAPDATIVNVRAGQDSGYFFLYETVAALTYAADIGLDVVNMSFYTDPWLYNCESADDYISGAVTPEQIADQAFVRSTVLAATAYANDHGVSMVGSAGNEFTNLALPTRFDASSPDFPPDVATERVVTDNCLDLPSEAPEVISVSSTGPSGTKSDFSNYGFGDVEVAAPGGWFRDGIGTPTFQTPGNEILSSYPLEVAIAEGLANPDGTPTDDFSVQSCKGSTCGFYTYSQGTSMASPHVVGVIALIIEAHGRGNPHRGYHLDPAIVRSILLSTATDHACPAGGVEIYTDEGRPAEWNAVCEGTTANNGLYGEGIVNATAAVRRHP